jgi:transcriptional regulator with XRE-family HTH domain
MDDLKVGAMVRMLRRKRRLRQVDVAALAGVGQSAVSSVERGQLERMSVSTIRRIGSALELRLSFEPAWRGGQLARLLDSRHASMVEQVVSLLASYGWEVAVEYTFAVYGERGAVDVLAWQPRDRALLVVEVKTELDDLQNLLSVLDRKTRLVPGLVASERGWRAATLGVVAVLAEGSSSRDAVARHRAIFGASLPQRNVEIRLWIRRPGSVGLRGLWFLRPSGSRAAMKGGGGPRRVRAARPASSRPSSD